MPAARHEEFTVEVRLGAPPAAVYAAFADPERRRRWIRMPGSGATYTDDFRVGGVDVARSTFRTPEGDQHLENVAHHLELETDRRIVQAYTAAVDGTVRWASLATVELLPDGGGTTLRWTEQVAFLAPSERPEDDLPHLRGAVRLRLNGLAAALTP